VITSKLIPTRNDLPETVRAKTVKLLNQQLADTADLYSQTKFAHWNVKGPQFYQLHLLFNTLAEAVEGYIDLIAERTTALGGIALGTVRLTADESRLPEYPQDVVDGREHLEALRDRYASLAKSSRDAIEIADSFGDPNTSDLFTQVSRGLDQHLWMVEAHLQG
jgi:starvation-inducible DNA-binding protein